MNAIRNSPEGGHPIPISSSALDNKAASAVASAGDQVFRVLLFGDQTTAAGPSIKDLHHQSKKSYSLQAFLQNTIDALQCNISGLNPSERTIFPAFQSVLDLAELQCDTSDHNVVLSTVLLCTAQLGALIM